MYWLIKSDIIPSYCNIVSSPSDTGDHCHYDIYIKKVDARNLLPRTIDSATMFICDGHGQSRPIQSTDLE
jgi:hypothetical protein